MFTDMTTNMAVMFTDRVKDTEGVMFTNRVTALEGVILTNLVTHMRMSCCSLIQ